MAKPVIAITMGDPGGVGPEVIVKTLRRIRKFKKAHFLIVGTLEPFEYLRKKASLKLPLKKRQIHFLDVTESARAVYSKSKTKSKFHFQKGKVSLANAAMAYASLQEATSLALEGQVDAVVTAPLNKTSMRLLDVRFQGHTEYLASRSKVSKYAMMFVSPKLKVTLATIHVPIKKVSALINRRLVEDKIVLTHQFLKKHLKLKTPKLAVCALNPHGRETGTEDEAEIRPAVKRAQKKKIRVEGPFSADQLFFDAYEGHYDALISMYHDQALAPFKMISFRDGVNVTLGLPFIRTSPDHGTAFDIAYKGKADPISMQSALELAIKLTR